jgi:hypothetical protein
MAEYKTLAVLPHEASRDINLVLVRLEDGTVVDEHEGLERSPEDLRYYAKQCDDMARSAAERYQQYAKDLREAAKNLEG